jgi:N-acetylneuraminic acid mutarotase
MRSRWRGTMGARASPASGGRRVTGPCLARLSSGVVAAMLLLAVLPGAAAVAAAQSGSWTVLTPMPGPQREGGYDVMQGRIYAVGGFLDPLVAEASAVVHAYDVASDRWSVVAPLPEAVHHGATAALDGKLYVIGGYGSSMAQRRPLASVWAYDPAANRWEPRAPLPAPRGAAAVAVLDGLLYALGGERLAPAGAPPGYQSVADVSVYDPRTDRWEELPPMRYPREHLVAGSIGGRIYAVGGRDRPILDLPFVEEYDPATRTWRERAPMPTGRSSHAGAVLGGRLYVFGGEGNPASPRGVFGEVEVYDPTTDSWTLVDHMPTPRHGQGAVAVGNRIYLPGGSARQGGLGPGATTLFDAYDPE